MSACYTNQEGNPDFGSCAEQDARYCGQGNKWIMAKSTDTRASTNNVQYGLPECTTDATAAAAGGAPVTIDELRTLLILDPKIHSDNGGRGVRHAETNFYTLEKPKTLNTTIGGQRVELRATPVSFEWDYGDGTGPVTTTESGHPAAKFNTPTPTSHVYRETGSYPVTLTTTYIGEYRVEGGAWQLIPGTIVLDATPAVADIWRTVTRNVADDCSSDPSAWGCSGTVDSPADR